MVGRTTSLNTFHDYFQVARDLLHVYPVGCRAANFYSFGSLQYQAVFKQDDPMPISDPNCNVQKGVELYWYLGRPKIRLRSPKKK